MTTASIWGGTTPIPVIQDGQELITIADYATLRTYTGNETALYVVKTGFSGLFKLDATDLASADNSGTIIVSVSGARWKREYSGHLNVKWFGALGDSVTNDTAAINLALAAAYALGKQIYIPSGTYRLGESSAGSGRCLLNKGVSIYGEGRTLSILAPLSTLANTVDLMWLKPDIGADISFIEFTGFFMHPKFDGTRRGKRSIFGDFSSLCNMSKFWMHHCAVQEGNDWGIEFVNVQATNTQGVPAFSKVSDNIFYDGVKLQAIGDSCEYQDNVNNTPVGSGRQGLWLYHTDFGGNVSSHTMIHGNAMASCDGGVIKVIRGRNVKIFNNNIEQSFGAGSNGAVIDLDGSGGTMAACSLKDNHIGFFGTTTVNTVVRINGCAGLEVESNTILGAFLIPNCFNLLAPATDCFIGRNYIDKAKFTNVVNDAGTGTAGIYKAVTISLGAVTNPAVGYGQVLSYKDRESNITLRGVISHAGIANNTVIGSLPAGRRPLVKQRFVVQSTIAAATSGAGVVEVDTAGTITYFSTVGNATLLSFDGINFPIDPVIQNTL